MDPAITSASTGSVVHQRTRTSIEHGPSTPGVEGEEQRGEYQHHDKHPPAQALAHCVARHDASAAHPSAHRLEVGVLECRGQHAHRVHAARRPPPGPQRSAARPRAPRLRTASFRRRLHLHATRLCQRRRRALLHDPPAQHDRHPVAHQLHLGEKVRVQQYGHAPLAQARQQVAHGAPAHRVESAGGLVEHEQPWRADQRLRDTQAAAACPSTSRPPSRRPPRPSPLSRAARRARRRHRRSAPGAGAAPAAHRR